MPAAMSEGWARAVARLPCTSAPAPSARRRRRPGQAQFGGGMDADCRSPGTPGAAPLRGDALKASIGVMAAFTPAAALPGPTSTKSLYITSPGGLHRSLPSDQTCPRRPGSQVLSNASRIAPSSPRRRPGRLPRATTLTAMPLSFPEDGQDEAEQAGLLGGGGGRPASRGLAGLGGRRQGSRGTLRAADRRNFRRPGAAVVLP